MQLYIDPNGIQQFTTGQVVIDEDSGEPILIVVWDFNSLEEIELDKVGGYSVVNGELVYSQSAFDGNEANKAALLEAEQEARENQLTAFPILKIVLAIVDLVNEERAARRALSNAAGNVNLNAAQFRAAIANAEQPANITYDQVVTRIKALLEE